VAGEEGLFGVVEDVEVAGFEDEVGWADGGLGATAEGVLLVGGGGCERSAREDLRTHPCVGVGVLDAAEEAGEREVLLLGAGADGGGKHVVDPLGRGERVAADVVEQGARAWVAGAAGRRRRGGPREASELAAGERVLAAERRVLLPPARRRAVVERGQLGQRCQQLPLQVLGSFEGVHGRPLTIRSAYIYIPAVAGESPPHHNLESGVRLPAREIFFRKSSWLVSNRGIVRRRTTVTTEVTEKKCALVHPLVGGETVDTNQSYLRVLLGYHSIL
jgi:hypothetical protein